MKVSPDGVVQNAIQLAFKRAFGQTVATYESASTAGFLRGRTETIRPATIESKAFVSDPTDKSKLIAAAETHRKNSTLAAIGQGFVEEFVSVCPFMVQTKASIGTCLHFERLQRKTSPFPFLPSSQILPTSV